MMNTFGEIYRLTSFGESHGAALGGIIDGVPAGIAIDMGAISLELKRRRPGQSALTTGRTEPDDVEILSGIFNGVTTGAPIGFIIRNKDFRSADYEPMRNVYRPGHADYTYTAKYGHRDYHGGGRASARETVSRIVAGAIAKQALAKYGIRIFAYTSQVGKICVPEAPSYYKAEDVDKTNVRCPDAATAFKMEALIMAVKTAGDTIGGVITGVIKGCPAGLGDPVFGKLQARLASAMMSINAAKGFDYGLGFEDAGRLGSEMIDPFTTDETGSTRTLSNHSGGIQGGISNGEDIYFRVAFKPVATLLKEVDTIDSNGNATKITAKGRHDPCVLPRAVPVVEAMAAMVILDSLLLNRTARL